MRENIIIQIKSYSIFFYAYWNPPTWLNDVPTFWIILIEKLPFGVRVPVYEMVTLHPPFESEKGNIFDLFQKIQNEDIQVFDSQRYSSGLFNIVKSMLEKDPMKRPNIKEILETTMSNL